MFGVVIFHGLLQKRNRPGVGPLRDQEGEEAIAAEIRVLGREVKGGGR